MNKVRVCASNPINGEYSLCGDAFDIAETEDGAEPFVMAEPGDVLTCSRCKKLIQEIRECFPRGFKHK